MHDEPDEIPLFPLPSVVLFPLATVPLFVFEPRYRQMTADALQGATRRIGMIAVPREHHDEMPGNPPLAPVGCEGEIVAAERSPDGTYRMLLRGTRRFRIREESPPEGSRLYRTARVETLRDVLDEGDREALGAGRAELLALLSDLVQRTAPKEADAFRPHRFDDVEDAQLVNTFAQAIDFDPHDKQLLLELDRVLERQRMLCDLLRFRIAALRVGGGSGSETVH